MTFVRLRARRSNVPSAIWLMNVNQDPETLYRRPIQILIAPAAPSIIGPRSSDELHSILFSIGQLRSIHAIPRDLLLADAPINQ